MLIIPYIKPGSLQSNSMQHFNTISDAISYAYDKTITKAEKFNEKVTTRFRILDSEEDFDVSYCPDDSKFDYEIKFYII